MIKASALALIVFLACTLVVQAKGQVRGFVVTAQTLSSNGAEKKILCNSEQNQCFLALPFEGREAPIDVAVSIHSNEARFQFMQDRRYLPIRSDGLTTLVIPLKNNSGAAEIDVLDPQSLEPENAITKTFLKPGRRVARISLNIQAEPSNN